VARPPEPTGTLRRPQRGEDLVVLSDGELVFSKKQVGRFPEHDEILAALRTA